MSESLPDRGPVLTSSGDSNHWRRVVPALGVLVIVVAIARAVFTLASSGILLEAILDLILIGSLGIVMLYLGVWLPNTTIRPEFYPRVVAWVVGGVTVMAVVLALRVVHPGVSVQYTFGTQAVLLATGSLAGLGAGVLEAQTLIHAKTLEAHNEELRRTEQRLEEAVAQLEDSNERLEQFASAASHDMQEPLRMVTRYLELVERRHGEDLDEEAQEFLAFAADGADRMSAMIDGLLAYSQVDAGTEAFETVDLDALLDDVLTDLQVTLEETGAEVEREPLPTVAGDERQLRQVFQNLLTNAVQYSGDDPPAIHVSAAREGATWTVSVRDEGPGIDPADGDRVFDVFERCHSGAEQSGSGIGLALCKRVVEAHGGEIWVDSAPGEGATFSFTVPADE